MTSPLSPSLLPPFAIDAARHDRIAERRDDMEFLAKAWADAGTRTVLVSGSDIAVAPGGGSLWTVGADEAPSGTRVLLGSVEGQTWVAVLEPDPGQVADLVAAGPGSLVPLRSVLTAVSSIEASLAAHAVALANWHRTHPRCSVCGEPTDVAQSGAMRRCPACGTQHFPRNDPAVIMTVIDDQGRCLLGHNAARDSTWYSTLAGFVEPGEALEDAVAREVAEETGVRVDRVDYLGSQPWPFPSSLMVGFVAHAAETDIAVDGVEITAARWFTRDDLRTEVEAGRLVIPTTVSISGALLQHWFGAELPAAPG